jgi:hypothetical protein
MARRRKLDEDRLLIVGFMAVLGMPICAGASDEMLPTPIDKINYYVSGGMIYDDNLFRLPTSFVATPASSGVRADEIYIGSLGVDGNWVFGRQTVDFDLHIDRNEFQHNDQLDNTSHNDRVVLNWSAGSRISGQAGVDFARALTDFTNTRDLARDLVASVSYFGNARLSLGPRLGLVGEFRYDSITHSVIDAQFNDYHSKTSGARFEYIDLAGNTVFLEYRHVSARYPPGFLINNEPFNEDYDENISRVFGKYVVTQKTQVEGYVGYLRRTYPYAGIGGFSGGVWNGTFRWVPTSRTELTLNEWRQLEADLNAESEYFVSRGEGITPEFVYSPKLSFTLMATYDDQRYFDSTAIVPTLSMRHDRVIAQQLGLLYKPRINLSVRLSYRHEIRNSNLAEFEYRDNLANLRATYAF